MTRHPRLQQFIEDMDAIYQNSGTSDDLSKIEDLVGRIIKKPDWMLPEYTKVDEEQGWTLHYLYCAPDRSLCAFVTSWLPGRGAPPHDHGCWAIIGGVIGDEKNVFWQRVENGSQPDIVEIEMTEEVICQPGDVLTMTENDIHSVWNDGNSITTTLHVYGCHPNDANRTQFDPDAKKASPFVTQIIPSAL